MYLNQNWRILTIGDGDLSFSSAVAQYHQPKCLVASVYDSLSEVERKYGLRHYNDLQKQQIQVVSELDITKPNSFAALDGRQFDLVIFQFPLHPGFDSKEEYHAKPEVVDNNLLNRQLLRYFLLNSLEYLLDSRGAQLCYITSKDVKPYSDWNIENSLLDHSKTQHTFKFVGQMSFDAILFSGYRVRNVNRDKYVKSTAAKTFVWCAKKCIDKQLENHLCRPKKHLPDHCILCGAGAFLSEQDRVAHEQSKTHRRLAHYEKNWQKVLQQA